jgi:hypothetical protein
LTLNWSAVLSITAVAFLAAPGGSVATAAVSWPGLGETVVDASAGLAADDEGSPAGVAVVV